MIDSLQVWICLYRQSGMEPKFSYSLNSESIITPTDEKQRKWTNKVSLQCSKSQAKR